MYTDENREGAVHPSGTVILALVTVQVLFALWPVAGAAALVELSPMALAGFRMLLGALLMMLFLFPRVLRVRPRPGDFLWLAVLGAFGIAANQLLYVEGLKRAGPINAVILIVTIPVVTLVVATLLGFERFSVRRALGLLVSAVGVLLLVKVERFSLENEEIVGSLFLFGNMTCYAIYLVWAKPVVQRLGPLVVVAWVYVFGALEALIFVVKPVAEVSWGSLRTESWIALGFILVGPTFGTYFLNAYALKRAESSVVALFIGLQPLVGMLGAWLILGQVPTIRALVAGMIILCGVMLATYVPRRASFIS